MQGHLPKPDSVLTKSQDEWEHPNVPSCSRAQWCRSTCITRRRLCVHINGERRLPTSYLVEPTRLRCLDPGLCHCKYNENTTLPTSSRSSLGSSQADPGETFCIETRYLGLFSRWSLGGNNGNKHLCRTRLRHPRIPCHHAGPKVYA